MKLVSRFAAAVLVLSLFGADVSAQVFGMPVNYAPASTGVTLHGGVGRGVNNDSGKLTSLGGGVIIGMPTLSFAADVSYFDLDTTKKVSFGGHVAYGLPLPPGTPIDLSIVAGVGVLSIGGTTQIFVPAGLTLAFDVPSTGVAVTPWVSPQFRYFRISGGGFSATNSDFGVSGGLDITLPMGFGFQALGDYDNGSSAFTVGGGVHYSISVPSIGGGM